MTNNRKQILRGLVNAAGRGLEIGPSHNPIMPKSEGFNVEIVDHADKQALIKKYENDPSVNTATIEDVDYVSDGRPLTELIGTRNSYDYIIASHVIEHTPDMLMFLKDCEALLAPDGLIVIAVPDKRFCFDVFRPISTVGAVLQAHLERRTRPQPGTIFDHVAYNAKRGGAPGWSESDRHELRITHDIHKAIVMYDMCAGDPNRYMDAHVWCYVPSSFRLIVEDLRELGHLSLGISELITPGGFEFFVALSTRPNETRISRSQTLVMIQDELRNV
ncbi:methyltransferase domain-containing protein [Aminobacter sp. MDW-2]|jgi:SAM-dependent methyltransferase|uniref:class I SAM-dependent methyltransferase n=1 Tax=Aminobacter sp. MDW-2 TaxID=2666139 RepID=UPI0012B15957|nr:methyltransferase domain-containing protein [Aminobacter sp. MDW-2]MRX32263.1 methyltransferase domain-containing protein [Aminobacter sp. MDW-2]QNH37477.1 methyltransferase domain-containing protein [Aminobacter sp. MDW-2]